MTLTFEKLKSKYKHLFWWMYKTKKKLGVVQCTMWLQLPNYVSIVFEYETDIDTFCRAQVREYMADTIMLAALDVLNMGTEPRKFIIETNGVLTEVKY